MANSFLSSLHHDLLNLDLVAVDESEHVDARGDVDGLGGGAGDAFAAEHATEGVDHLEGGLAVVVDDPHAVVEEGEGVVVVVAGGEDEGEAAGSMRCR